MEHQDALLVGRYSITRLLMTLEPAPTDKWIADVVDRFMPLGRLSERREYKPDKPTA